MIHTSDSMQHTPSPAAHMQAEEVQKVQTSARRQAADTLSADTSEAVLPMQFMRQKQDTVSAKQQVEMLQKLFANDSLAGAKMQTYKIGVAGDPVPYSLAGDNLVTSLLIGCFIVVLLAVSQSRSFIIKQTKSLFLSAFVGEIRINETARELRFQLLMALQTCLLGALVYYFYAARSIGQSFILEQYQLIGIYTVIAMLYFLVKAVAYQTVNRVFFEKKAVERWNKSFLFMVAAEGTLFFPIVLLHSYFHMPAHTTFVASISVVIFFKILSFYNAYLTFFRQKGAFLQIFLYFCTLEIVPFAALWGVLQMTSTYLKINF